VLCEGYLGIESHFERWRYFFSITLLKKREKGRLDLLVSMGHAGVQLWTNRATEFMSLQLSRSNKGWHTLWFYSKNDATAPLPDFIRHLIEEAP
jgi:hypothetical protein